MYFTIATDQKRVTIATDGKIFGKAVLSIEEEGPFDIKTGIGTAIMNIYLAQPKPKFSLEVYPAYYLVYVDPAYMLRYTTSAVRMLHKYDPPLVAQSWGSKLDFLIVSVSAELEEVRRDKDKVLTGDWRWDSIPETRM